ncbi:hypothetical protein DEU56DRAFT_760874 [Suillus clintonianus]|uniref:uncharacterized protein n=1 Tax=Suillus clintonianus TaxID=1904413 RepID=UPI001B871318|nr:uncharacterized protein DEU56DRAFT_760874 [Suillus clintonianus]KAG2120227.1 hypothetical protein DEU56DRAFT_760874 [Suillus clintonianus]
MFSLVRIYLLRSHNTKREICKWTTIHLDAVSYAQIIQLVDDQTSNSSLSLTGSKIVQGIVFGYGPEGNSTTNTHTPSQGILKNVSNANGTILVKNADELINFTRGEEQQLEKIFKEITFSGIEVIITGSSIGDLALHSLNGFDTAGLKQSPLQVRPPLRSSNRQRHTLLRISAPTPEQAALLRQQRSAETVSPFSATNHLVVTHESRHRAHWLLWAKASTAKSQ